MKYSKKLAGIAQNDPRIREYCFDDTEGHELILENGHRSSYSGCHSILEYVVTDVLEEINFIEPCNSDCCLQPGEIEMAKKKPAITTEETTVKETKAEKKKRLLAVKDQPRKLKEMETRTVEFDGEKAEAWLLKNTKNRPIRKSSVKRLASLMEVKNRKREFKTTSQGISVNRQGIIQDGQHRLMAVVHYYENYENPKPVEMRVTEGEEDHFDYIDLGTNRNVADVFSSGGRQEDYPKELANAVRLLWIRYNGKRVGGTGKLSPHQLGEFLDDFPGLRDSVDFIMSFGELEDSLPCSELMSPGYAACLHFLMANAEDLEDASKVANDFWTQVIEQEGEKGSMPWKLVRKIKKVKSSKDMKMTRDALVDYCIFAFNKFADNDQEGNLTIHNSVKPVLGGIDGAGVEEETEE